MRPAARRRAVLGMAACLASGSIAASESTVCGANLRGSEHAASASYTVAYRTRPAPVKVSQHFAVEFEVCGHSGAPAPEAVRVDARMPEHGHGMNYQALIRSLGAGRYRADGLMFHMPGRWQLVFDVRGGGSSEQVLHSITLR